jgi:hypothetical protein
MKVVINACFGGFSLSHEGVLLYCKLKGLKVWHEPDKKYPTISNGTYWLVPPEERPEEIDWNEASQEERIAHNQAHSKVTIYHREIERNDQFLVQVVEQLGDKAGGKCASLKVVEIPDGIEWTIEEYDGNEHIAEVHETWS